MPGLRTVLVLSHLILTEQLYEVSTIIISVLKKRKLRLSEGGRAEIPTYVLCLLIADALNLNIIVFVNYKDLRKHD